MSTPEPAPDPSALLLLAVSAAQAAGHELLRRFGAVEGLDTKSSATDPVSDADRAAEDLIMSILLGQRPTDGIVGEEGAARPRPRESPGWSIRSTAPSTTSTSPTTSPSVSPRRMRPVD